MTKVVPKIAHGTRGSHAKLGRIFTSKMSYNMKHKSYIDDQSTLTRVDSSQDWLRLSWNKSSSEIFKRWSTICLEYFFHFAFPKDLIYVYFMSLQFATSQEVSNVRALQILERKVLLSILNSRKLFERDFLLSDSVAKSATRKLCLGFLRLCW